MTKSAEDVEREVEASRIELERTVEALKEKMTPGEIFREASGAMGASGNRMMMKVNEQAKENPVPVALIGLGLAWLAVNQSRKTSGYSGAYAAGYGIDRSATDGDYYDDASRGPGLKTRVSDAAHGIADKASGLVGSAKERVAGAASGAKDTTRSAFMGAKDTTRSAFAGARDTTRSAMDGVSQRAAQVRERAGEVGQRVKQRATDAYESEPLLLGALGLVVGVAIGAALPATPAEARVLGPTRDKLLGKGKDLARTQVDTVKGVAQTAYGRVKEELQRGDGEGGDLGERVGAAATAGIQAVRDGVQDQTANGAGTTH
ncbi:DUF3618 domain-containing protein [Phenylobacterium sp.]|jgi:hypothetical protein|uniref:DUF3618 domain-containing protein n=1 Tax=Phenylobacterium sp. TaxID=1871053 RepID=UPI002F931B0C